MVNFWLGLGKRSLKEGEVVLTGGKNQLLKFGLTAEFKRVRNEVNLAIAGRT